MMYRHKGAAFGPRSALGLNYAMAEALSEAGIIRRIGAKKAEEDEEEDEDELEDSDEGGDDDDDDGDDDDADDEDTRSAKPLNKPRTKKTKDMNSKPKKSKKLKSPGGTKSLGYAGMSARAIAYERSIRRDAMHRENLTAEQQQIISDVALISGVDSREFRKQMRATVERRREHALENGSFDVPRAQEAMDHLSSDMARSPMRASTLSDHQRGALDARFGRGSAPANNWPNNAFGSSSMRWSTGPGGSR